MADEQNFEESSANLEAAPEAENSVIQSPASADEAAGAAAPEARPKKHTGLWFGINLIFVLAVVAGIFSYAAEKPVPWILGAGLLGWSILDFIAQRRSLPDWKGSHAVWMNVLNILRALFFGCLGAWLLLQGLGKMQALSANTLLVSTASFLCAYLICAYALELATRASGLLPHAVLLAALALQFLAFFCFAVPFTITWAAVLSFASFACAGWAIWKGVTKTAPSLAASVATATLLVGLPFVLFFVDQVFVIEQQPVYQASLFLPRFYKLEKNLTKEAANLAWAPGNTQTGALGDIPFSDKIALIDQKDGKKILKVYVHGEDQSAMAECPMDLSTGPAWWSPDSSQLVATGIDVKHPRGILSLYHWTKKTAASGKDELLALRSPLEGQDVLPMNTHGQVWSKDGKTIYFSGPAHLRRKGGCEIFSAKEGKGGDLELRSLAAKPSKVYPAAAPDGSRILYVTEKENQHFLEIADTAQGIHPRLFGYAKEANLFPAWNQEQTKVLFVDGMGKLKIMSANNKSDAVIFSAKHLHSHVWKSETGKVFTLNDEQTGEIRQLWTMNPDGSHKKMIYEAACSEILPPVWSADSARIALIERRDDHYAVLTMARDGSWPRRFFMTSDHVRSLTWSPDSQRLAWFADRHQGKDQELWIVEKDSSNPELAYAGQGDLASLSWSPAGQHLAFEERWSYGIMGLRVVRPDLYSVKVLDIKDHQARSLTLGGLFARQPAFSPQGVMIAFMTEQNRWSLMPSPKRPALLAVVRLF